jgi:hypothetical protein
VCACCVCLLCVPAVCACCVCLLCVPPVCVQTGKQNKGYILNSGSVPAIRHQLGVAGQSSVALELLLELSSPPDVSGRQGGGIALLCYSVAATVWL